MLLAWRLRQALIRGGASVSKGDLLGRTALHLAAMKGHVKVSQSVREAGGRQAGRQDGGVFHHMPVASITQEVQECGLLSSLYA